MKHLYIWVAALFSVMVLLAFGAWASDPDPSANNCAERSIVVERLLEVYNESSAATGFIPEGGGGSAGLFELWVAPNTNTWTITGTNPFGLTCIILWGENFNFSDWPSTPPPEGDPT